MDLLKYFGQPPVPEKLKKHLLDTDQVEVKTLKHLSKINVFIGPNNSGKSLLIRELLKTTYEGRPSEAFHDEIKSEIGQIGERFVSGILEDLKPHVNCNIVGLRTRTNAIHSIESIKSFFVKNHTDFDNSEGLGDYLNEFNEIMNSLIQSSQFELDPKRLSGINSNGQDSIKRRVEKAKNEQAVFREKYTSEENTNRIYIPTTRTLRVFEAGSKIFSSKIWGEYNFGDSNTTDTFKNKPVIENGENFYENISELRNSTIEKEDRFKEFERFLSINFFEGASTRIITNQGEKVIYIKIGNEKEQPIYNYRRWPPNGHYINLFSI